MPRKILIVDDSAINRLVLRNILREGYEIMEAEDGAQALDLMRLHSGSLSAVLLDLYMPVMDGYELLRLKNLDPSLAQLPVIVATGSSDTDAENRAFSLGANDFVTKPYNAVTIKQRLWNIINLRETSAAVNAMQLDALTGLYNREFFFQKAAELIAGREPGYFILSCLDVDNFKVINDQYGSEKGDSVLKGIASVLKKDCEAEECICCRITADNFAVLYPRRLMGAMDDSRQGHSLFLAENIALPVTVSVGRYAVEDKALSVSSMYDRALLAQSTVKGRFDVHVAMYRESMREKLLREQEIVNDMNSALALGQFEVWFQPQYNHSSGARIGAEALVRWRHPARGLVSPGDFIPVFERNGFVYELDKYVWEQACMNLRRWTDEGRSPLPISVNVSRYDLFREDLMDTVTGLTEKYAIPAELLRLEITESAFTDPTGQMINVVQGLIDRGFTVEIDDFGSGYSSLNTLKSVPAQIVKLDMKFLEGDDDSGRGGSIIESVVRMVKWLGMSVIAEGVETAEQAEYLKSIGCNYVQGYLYARPMPVEEYERLSLGRDKEEKMIVLETVENLDNNAFWNPMSMDTLIFNSYVGAACILEHHDGKIEMLRATEKFPLLFGGGELTVKEAQRIDWARYLEADSLAAFREALISSIATKGEYKNEYVFADLPGCPGKTYLYATMRVIATAGPRSLIYCICENRTSQRKAEQQEHEIAQQLQTIMRNMDGGVSVARMNGRDSQYLFANEQFFSMLGYTREQFYSELPRGLADIIHPEDIDRVSNAVMANEDLQGTAAAEFRVYRRDGSLMWMRTNGSVCRMDGAEGPVHIAVHTDVTAEKESLLRIRSLNENLQNLMNDTPGGFARLKVLPGGGLSTEYVNESFCRLRGMTAEEILSAEGKDALCTVHPDDLALVRSTVREMTSTGETCHLQYRLQHSDGGYIPVNVFGRMSTNDRGEMFLNVYYADMSRQEREELSMRETVPYVLSAIMKYSTDLVFAKDKDFRYICCSPAFVRFTRQSSESDVIGKTDYDFWTKEEADRFRQDDERLFESGEPLTDYVEPIPSDDGIQHYCSTSKYILRDAAGAVIGMYGIGRDITQARADAEQLKLLTDSIQGGLATYVLDERGLRLTYFNDGLCRMLGYTREEYELATRDGVMAAVFEGDAPLLRAQIDRMARDGIPVDCTYRVRSRSGSGCKWVNLRVSPAERMGGALTANAVLYDVTEQKLAEEAALIHDKELKLALSSMSRIIAEFDVEERTLTLPEPYCRKYGYPAVARDMPEGMRALSEISDEDFELYCGFYQSIIRGDSPEPIELRKSGADGAARWERLTAYTIFNENGKPVRSLIVADDVTEQHLSYELERRRPSLGEGSLLFRALFNLSTRETLEYFDSGENPVPPVLQLGSLTRRKTPEQAFVDEDERRRFHRLHDPEELLSRFEKGESELSLDYRRRMPDGEILWVRNLLRLVKKPGGSDVLLFEYCYNIEDEKLRELLNDALVTLSYDYVMRINGRNGGFTVIANDRVDECMPPLRGDDIDEAARGLAENGVHPDDREMVLQNTLLHGIKRNLANREQFQFTCRVPMRDGAVRYKKLTEYYLDRALDIIIVTREDITQIMEEENKKNSVLASALEAANQASLAKTQFLSRMSHELRTPMNAIIGLAALSAGELGNEKVMEDNIAKIGMSARYLLSLINDILEMARIESGKMTLNQEPFDFEQFVSNINSIVYSQASLKGVDYDVVTNSYLEPTYIGDATKLQEILINVLGNAVKFTPAGGKVTLSIEQLRRDRQGATLRFVATDTGTGIDSAFLPHIFDSFSQEHASLTSTAAGTGLGLAITKSLVDMMNGHIGVQSVKNVGSVFTIDLQLGVPEQSLKYLDLLASMNLSRLRALVVDDDVVVCRSTESVLRAMGMQTEWTDSGQLAVERVRSLHESRQDFDTIFIDWKMPDMDGIETTRQIRSIVGPEVTIIIMTAYDWQSIEAEATAAGVDLFMEKPLFQSSIIRAFERIFMAGKAKIEPAPQEQPDLTGRRILLAEDNALNVEIARRLLEKAGAEVAVVGNGLEALETYATSGDGHFDAILMDIRMPVMDGLAAAQNIRNLRKPGSRDIPIVAMTANAFDEDADRSLSSGMNAHLSKPVEPHILFATLERLIRDRERNAEYMRGGQSHER